MNFPTLFSKPHILIIAGGILLALFSVIDAALAIGALLAVFLCSLALFCIGTIKEKETVRFLSILFSVVFLLHVALVLFVYYANFQPFSDGRGDYTEYHFVAQEIANRVPAGNFSFEGLPLTHYYPVAIGYLYAATIPSMLMGQLLNAWIVALIAVFACLIVIQIGRSRREGFLVGILAGLYPSLAFYGSLLLKDALVVLLGTIALLLTFKIIKKFSWPQFIIFYLVLAGTGHLRFYISYALILNFIICWLFLSDFKIKKRVAYGVIMIILLGLLPRFSTLDGATQGYFGGGSVSYYLNTQTITGYRNLANPENVQKEEPQAMPEAPAPVPPVVSEEPVFQDSAVIVETGFKDPVSFLKNISLSFIYSSLGPFPWQLTQKRHLFVLPEMILWYVLLFFIARGIITSIKKEYRVILPLLIFSGIVFGVLSVYINNFGIVTRIRMPAFLALLCLLPFGLEKFKNTKIPFLEKYLHL
ncbi:MAG: hypothetical protein Q7S10_00065 [bacterium]|nr:hypothetical protein [bacterium]